MLALMFGAPSYQRITRKDPGPLQRGKRPWWISPATPGNRILAERENHPFRLVEVVVYRLWTGSGAPLGYSLEDRSQIDIIWHWLDWRSKDGFIPVPMQEKGTYVLHVLMLSVAGNVTNRRFHVPRLFLLDDVCPLLTGLRSPNSNDLRVPKIPFFLLQ